MRLRVTRMSAGRGEGRSGTVRRANDARRRRDDGSTPRRAGLLIALCVALCAIGASLPAIASANPFAIQFTKPEPVAPGATVKVPVRERVEYEVEFKDATENPVTECNSEAQCPGTVEWNFGDGTPPVTDDVTVGAKPSELITAAATHEYATEGTHEITVVITVKAGGRETVHLEVEVQPTLLTKLTPSQEYPFVNEKVSFTAEQLATPAKPPVHYKFFLDGLPNPVAELESSAKPWAAVYEKTFGAGELGAHTVTVSAEDQSAPPLKGSAEAHVEVVPPLGGTLRALPSSAQVGEPMSLVAEPTGGKPPYSYSWSADGAPIAGSAERIAAPFTGVPGAHSFSVEVRDSGKPPHTETLTGTAGVFAPLSASLSPSGEILLENIHQTVTFTAAAAGGDPPYSYLWTLTNGFGERVVGPFSTGSSPTFTRSFDFSHEATGTYTMEVAVGDAATHGTLAKTTIDFTPCPEVAEFGLVQIEAIGCMRPRTGSEGETEWTTPREVMVNGLPLTPTGGGELILRAPTKNHPGGQVESTGSAKITVPTRGGATMTVFEGHLDWSFPHGSQGEEKEVAGLNVPANQEVFHMKVGGEIALKLGFSESGEHYAALPLTIELPSIFKSGPSKSAGGVTAAATLKLNRVGAHFGGLRFEVHNVFIGALQLETLCLSDTVGGETKPCEKPKSIGGKEFIECNETKTSANFWQGTAVLVLPTPSQAKLAFFGGVVNGKLANLGGYVEANPGIPIVEGVFLDRVGVGVCLTPPPLKVKGEVGVAALPTPDGPALQVGGSFTYTDAFTDSEGNEHPWSIELAGGVNILGKEVGSGDIVVNALGNLEFEVSAHLNLYELVEAEGRVGGWIEPKPGTFNITGGIKGCVFVIGCAEGSAVFSSVGMAACLESEILGIETEFGFGYNWKQKEVEIFASSCDFGEYEASAAAARAAAAGVPPSVDIPAGTKAIALRVAGLGLPPRVILRGPGGQTILAPPPGAEGVRGSDYMAVQDRTNDSTEILLVKPAAGVWRVEPAEPGTVITSVETAHYSPPPVAHGRVLRAPHDERTLAATFALAKGEQIAIAERGRGFGGRTLRSDVAGTRCKHARTKPGSNPSRCLRLSFRPAFGPGGTRQIVGVVTRHGMPVKTIVIASFRVPKPTPPARPRLQLVRSGSRVTLAFSHGASAVHSTISVDLGNGRKFGFYLPARCRRVVISGVSRKTAVSVEAAGVEPDMTVGRYGHVSLRAGRARAGARGRLAGRLCS